MTERIPGTCPRCGATGDDIERTDDYGDTVTIVASHHCHLCECRWDEEWRVTTVTVAPTEPVAMRPAFDPNAADPRQPFVAVPVTAPAPFPLCSACADTIGGACAGPDAPWRPATEGEACGADNCCMLPDPDDIVTSTLARFPVGSAVSIPWEDGSGGRFTLQIRRAWVDVHGDPMIAGVVTFASPELDGELSGGDDATLSIPDDISDSEWQRQHQAGTLPDHYLAEDEPDSTPRCLCCERTGPVGEGCPTCPGFWYTHTLPCDKCGEDVGIDDFCGNDRPDGTSDVLCPDCYAPMDVILCAPGLLD